MRQSIKLRQQLRDSIESEINTRILEHQQNVAHLKAVGATPSAGTPLVMLAHGDSWFDYPLIGNGPLLGNTDVIAHLKSMGTPAPLIHNIAHFGEATTDELSVPKQKRLIENLKNPDNWLGNSKPDAILFSGGGNDIAGNQFCIFLNYFALGIDGLNTERFSKAIGMVEASYLDLFAFRDHYAPKVPIFGHCYAFPFVTGQHPVCAGPWLEPSIQFCGWSNAQGTDMVKRALQSLKERLQYLADNKGNNFILIDTQNTSLTLDLWANELHPQPEGFRLIAENFLVELRRHFQGRI